MNALAELQRLSKGVVLHDLACPPKGWDYSQGDFVLNEDGSKKCADDCRGCALDAALSALVERCEQAEARADRLEAKLLGTTEKKEEKTPALLTGKHPRQDVATEALHD